MSQSQTLTIEQAISRAKKAIRKGNIDAAVELYNAVLQHQPNHPVAKRGLRKLQKGLPRNKAAKTAITNPPQDQIDALVNLYHSQEMVQAERVCSELLEAFPQSLVVINILGAALQAQGKLQEAVAIYDKAILVRPGYVEAHSNRGGALKELGFLQEAIESCDKAIQLNPDYAEAYSNRGNAFFKLGQLETAIENYDKAIQLKPELADAYSNRGVALRDLGRVEEALESYDKVIQLNPNYAEAYSNRGVALQGLGRLEEAVQCYDRAIQLRPDYAEAYSNRGNAQKDLRQTDAAISSYQRAVSINPQNDLLWTGFAKLLQVVHFTCYSDELGDYLLQVLERPVVRPKDVSPAVVSALHYHPTVIFALELSSTGSIDENIGDLTVQLSTVPLLLRTMELNTIADVDIERMLTRMRRTMLHKAVNGGRDAQGLSFYAALAMHCFTNEFVFSECEEEKQEVEGLQERVKVTLETGGIVSPEWIAILGAYRPLSYYLWADELLKHEWPSEIESIAIEQINSVREEQSLRSRIPCLTSIEDKTSQLVRNQYEENPYPRWVNVGVSSEAKSVRQVLRAIELRLDLGVQSFSNNPDILIAGCGTGQHAIGTASLFRDCNVLAVDLSLSSLSYAIRKTQELGISNIEYMQADILKLNQLEREFDIIESAGVLHHMDDPIAGWQVLVDRLRQGGVMKIALYSELARRCVVEARQQIIEKGYVSTPDDIRRYREEMFNMDLSADSEPSKIIGSADFYSLSECRDLLFHVQEHRFTLIQIEQALKHLGLKFLGFELPDRSIRNSFSALYPENDAEISLSLWHQFELESPDTFNGMYQFWVQKA